MDKEKILIKVFKTMLTSTELDETRIKIEHELYKIIDMLKKDLRAEQKIFSIIESRAKTLESFSEKIVRKRYIEKWNIDDYDKEIVKKKICKNLPDLIGFRINCFFIKDEVVIYDLIKKYYQNKCLCTDLSLNFDENTKQSNGHTINKFTGIYQKNYCFEVQIKSIVHNVWGEVEHKTVYKNQKYDEDLIPRKELIEGVFSVLEASDNQLVTLFSQEISEKKLIYALFFEKTYKLSDNTQPLLPKHYKIFFTVFSDLFSSGENQISIYLGQTLLNAPFFKSDLPYYEDSEIKSKIKNKISSEFNDYDLKVLHKILAILFRVEDFDAFLNFLANYLVSTYFSELGQDVEEPEFDDDDFGDDCGDEANCICNDIIQKLKHDWGI